MNGLCLGPLGKPHKDAGGLVQTRPAGRQLQCMAVWNGSSKLGKPNHMMTIPGNTNPQCFPSLTWGNGFLGLGCKFLDMMQKGSLKTHSKPIYAFNWSQIITIAAYTDAVCKREIFPKYPLRQHSIPAEGTSPANLQPNLSCFFFRI